MALTYKLEHPKGTPADPPTFRSSAGTSWNIGDVLYVGRRTLRIIGMHRESDDEPVLIVDADRPSVEARAADPFG